jgi:hypothetical protein
MKGGTGIVEHRKGRQINRGLRKLANGNCFSEVVPCRDGGVYICVNSVSDLGFSPRVSSPDIRLVRNLRRGRYIFCWISGRVAAAKASADLF